MGASRESSWIKTARSPHARTPGWPVTQRESDDARFHILSSVLALGLLAATFACQERSDGELGEQFDVRRFRDAAIGSGAMPLAILERHIAWFIAQEKTRED